MNSSFQPGVAAMPVTKVELSVSCRNLLDKDTFSKSDPMCVLKVQSKQAKNSWIEHGRTEVIKDSLNPEFVKKFVIDYYFEERQILRFELWDVDSPSQRLENHDFLGCMECSLGEIVSAPSSKFEKPLVHQSRKCGSIFVRSEEMSSCKDEITVQMKGSHLDKKDFFGKSDPFLIFYRVNEDLSYTCVHKTEVVKNTLNPTWRPFVLPVRRLCNGDHDRSIKVECFDWDSDGGHDFIGEFSTNLRELVQAAQNSHKFEVVNPKKAGKKKNYKNSGEISILSCQLKPIFTFLDFIQSGMQVHFTVAIDFTASNGNPNNPSSLHYMTPYQPSQYSAAIQAVGNIVQDYDTDKLFPVLGFGAKLRGNDVVSHEFAVNFQAENPYCQGVGGILYAYQQALPQIQLYGPTNFTPVINHVARFAQACGDGSAYFVLLIITDGIITDMEQTKDAIVRASGLPMSIVIVGVGNADFDAMDVLDADNMRLKSSISGQVADRDIVQFVRFNEFATCSRDIEMTQQLLAKEVLAEIPDQVTEFMKRRGITPKRAS